MKSKASFVYFCSLCAYVYVCAAQFALSRGNHCELTAQLSVPGAVVEGILGNAVPSDNKAVLPFSLTTQPRVEEISTSNTSAHTPESTLTLIHSLDPVLTSVTLTEVC